LVKKLYPWGDEQPTEKLCNYGKVTTNFPATTVIKTFPPNNYGLYDMCGNVWNWCNDWFSETSYNTKDNNNPNGPESGFTKVRRGASFNIIQTFRLRTSNRGAYDPNHCAINIGFRCVKDFIK
jgi:formylglycine-generating enzyme required for sulfatase activity